MKLIKVFHIISSLSRGGRERQLSILLSKNNMEVNNIAIVLNKTQSNYIEEYNLTDKIIFLKHRNIYKIIIELKNILKKEKPDIIWTWGGYEASFGMILSIFFNVIHINGSIRHGIVLYKWKQIWRKFILHLSKNIVSNSYAGLKANKIKRGQVLYNGISDFFFQSKLNKYLDRTNLLNLPQTTLLIISVANLVPYKDYFTVLSALQKLKKAGYEFFYLILGDGEMKSLILKYIEKCELENNVIIMGNINNVSDYLRISDLFIHSSQGEGCSNAIIEAMACGLPILASDTGGTSEIVKNHFGYLFEYKNSNQLYIKIIEILKNKTKLELMGENAKKYAISNFSIDTMILNYNKIVREIYNKK
ncbi:MAG: glycosyltransferase [Bacteroidota bacterium]